MARILLDTDVILCWLGGGRPPATLIPQLIERGEVLGWTPMQIADMSFFCRSSDCRTIDWLCQVLETVPTTEEVGRLAGAYLISYMESRHLTPNNAVIAATAVANGIPLWTLSPSLYPIPELQFYSP